jgi:hypothetical protein
MHCYTRTTLILSDETDYILSFTKEASDHLVDELHTDETVIGCGLSCWSIASDYNHARSLGRSILTHAECDVSSGTDGLLKTFLQLESLCVSSDWHTIRHDTLACKLS